MQKLESEFQSRLCMMRVKYYAAVKNQYASAMALENLSPRMKQNARALTAPLLGDADVTSQLLAIFREWDEVASIERLLEPEWLVTTELMIACHEGMENLRPNSQMLVGGLAARINQRLKSHGEDSLHSARKIGVVLQSLGVRTATLGRMGRGLALTLALKRKIHQMGAQFGIDRRIIATLGALEAGYGGLRCPLCEEFGLTKGLRFVEINEHRPREPRRSERGPLLAARDE